MVILSSCNGVSSCEASTFGDRGGRFSSPPSRSCPDVVAIISSVLIAVDSILDTSHYRFVSCQVSLAPTQPHPQQVATRRTQ